MKKFKPHMMYDPKTGKGYKAEKPEDHERMAKMGYTHDKPKEDIDENRMLKNPYKDKKYSKSDLKRKSKSFQRQLADLQNKRMRSKMGGAGRAGSYDSEINTMQNKLDLVRQAMKEDTTTADAGIPQDTKNMGPRLKTTVMHDKRRRKDKQPVLLKKFRKYIEDKGIV